MFYYYHLDDDYGSYGEYEEVKNNYANGKLSHRDAVAKFEQLMKKDGRGKDVLNMLRECVVSIKKSIHSIYLSIYL